MYWKWFWAEAQSLLQYQLLYLLVLPTCFLQLMILSSQNSELAHWKQPEMIANVLNRLCSENCKKNVSGHEVWMWSWVHLKHLWQAWIKCEPPRYTMRKKFLILDIHKGAIVFSPFCAHCANATTHNAFSFKITPPFSEKGTLLTQFFIKLQDYELVISLVETTTLSFIQYTVSPYHGSSTKLI